MSRIYENRQSDGSHSNGSNYWLTTTPWHQQVSKPKADGHSSNNMMVNKPQNSTNNDITLVGDSEISERLSWSLMRLKLKDRNEIREEVHGVHNLARKETPELLHNSLSSMNRELDRVISISRPNQYAFQKAQTLKKTFVNDSDFRLIFLRCELFDPIKAADRMMVYLDYIELLFGQRGLEEPLNMSFFNKQEMATLREGNVQLLPFRDRSGRRIMIVLWRAMSYSPVLRCKLWFYFHYVLTQDIETQRNGAVAIAWGGPDDLNPNEHAKGSAELPGSSGYKRVVIPSGRGMDQGIPVRFVAFHLCYRQDIPVYVKAFYVFVLDEKTVPRIIFHQGTKTEMKYKMLGYGIPISFIPDTDTGAVKLKNHSQWLRIRKLIENDPDLRTDICECPGMNDVLFRRAGSCSAHPGNAWFKNVLEAKKDEHKTSNQTEKRDISWSIVEDVERRNGRFFKWDTSQTCWIQMTDRSEIRLKVAMSIRDFNRQSRAIENRQSMKSSTDVFHAARNKKRKTESGSCFFPGF